MDRLRKIGRRKENGAARSEPGSGHVMVPISGHDVDKQVIRLAGVMARRQASKVTFIHVVEVPRSLPIDCEFEPERSRQILDNALVEAAAVGFTPETELLQSREAGSAIVDEARALNADLLLIGLPRLTVAGQPSLGKTVPHVLLHAPCRVVVLRP